MPTGCGHRITLQDLSDYGAFAAREADLNLSFVLDVNFGRSVSPALAAAHVAAVGEAGLWSRVHAVEIGNEQDHYARMSAQEQRSTGAAHRSMGYHYREYAGEFGSYVTALRVAGLPPKRVQGGTWCCAPNRMDQGARVACAGGFLSNLSNYLHGFAADLLSFSYHRYPTNHCAGGQVTPAELLADHASIGMAEWLAPLAASAAALSIDFVVGESNSVACGGISGVSDTFASALWVLDFLPQLSKAGVRMVNFHGGTDVVYTPIGFGSDGALQVHAACPKHMSSMITNPCMVETSLHHTSAPCPSSPPNNHPTPLQVRPLFYGLRLFAELTSNSSVWLDSRGTFSGRSPDVPTADPLCIRGLQKASACCAASCGVCGGSDCDMRPGGGSACCGHAISTSGRSCTAIGPPCLIDLSFQRSPVTQHATIDAHGTVRVLTVARSVKERASAPRQTTACVPCSANLVSAREAMLIRLEAPSLDSSFRAPITLGGQTWSRSTDGMPSGVRQYERVRGVLVPVGQESTSQECFHFELPPLSAAMLVVPAL